MKNLSSWNYWENLHLYIDFLLLSNLLLEAASKALNRSCGSSSLKIWIPSPLPHLEPPSKQNLPPSREPNLLKSFRFQLWNSFGGTPEVRENLLFWTWTLTGHGFDLLFGDGVWIRWAKIYEKNIFKKLNYLWRTDYLLQFILLLLFWKRKVM